MSKEDLCRDQMYQQTKIISIAGKDVRVGDELYNPIGAKWHEAFAWCTVRSVSQCLLPTVLEHGSTVQCEGVKIDTGTFFTSVLLEEGIAVRRYMGPRDADEYKRWVAAGKPGLGAWALSKIVDGEKESK